jgi:hypothetical protein
MIIAHIPIAALVHRAYFCPWPLVGLWGGLCVGSILCKN